MTESADADLTLYFAPHSRSLGALILVEELGAPYRLEVLDFKTGQHRQPPYLAVNPMGKVPAIRHRGAVVTEQVAIYLYLADEFAAAGLAPPIGDPQRGPYLRWMAFYGSAFEPALVDRSMKVVPPVAMSPYGSFETVVKTLGDLIDQSGGPWILGERFSAVDVLWGTALGWMLQFGLLDKTPTFTQYAERVAARPASARAREREQAIVAAKG